MLKQQRSLKAHSYWQLKFRLFFAFHLQATRAEFAPENIVIIAGINDHPFVLYYLTVFFFTLKQLFTLALVVSGGHLPESLRGSEKLLNNQWYQITWMHSSVSMHLRRQKLKSRLIYVSSSATQCIQTREKKKKDTLIFSRFRSQQLTPL